MRLRDKVAIITGAAQGVGAALAVGYAKEKAKIVVADILDGTETVDLIKKAKGEALYVKTDVTRQDHCDAMAREAYERFGKIDILVNNAAIFGSADYKHFTKLTTDEWNLVMEVNAVGAFHCTKAVFPYMKNRGGRIINIPSPSMPEGIPSMPHFVSAKAAVAALTHYMARELKNFGINVNAVAPSFYTTFDNAGPEENDALRALAPASKNLRGGNYPADILRTAIFLAGDDAGFVTGQFIAHNGITYLHHKEPGDENF